MNRLLEHFEDLRWDLWLVVATLGLVLCGVVMVFSAAANEEGMRFLWAQARFAFIGLVAMGVLMHVDYHHFERPVLIYAVLGVIASLLLIVFAFGTINGAHRWIRFGGFSLQPSELAKAALVIFLAWFYAQREEEGLLNDFGATIAPSGIVVSLLALLIIKEPDLGTTMMIGLIFVTMIFASGMTMKHLLKVLPVMVPILLFMVLRVGWRWKRVLAFWNPEEHAQGAGYQALQSLIAIGSGGINGRGFGLSKQKLNYLPEAQSDFIFAVIGEELGLIGAVTMVLVFGVFLYRGLRISRYAPDRFGQLMAVGFTVAIVAQAFFNISVTLSLVPTKGIPLPFISAGGTSLIITLATVGILLNISTQAQHAERSSQR